MICQRYMFSLSDELTFINGAYMSPILKSSEEAGIRGLRKKRLPSDLTTNDFFEEVDKARGLFTQLIGATKPHRSVIIPSASYGLANVANNLPLNGRKKVILLGDQFPSNYYIWDRMVREKGLEIMIVEKPKDGSSWSARIIDAIDHETLAVTMAPLHWGDGSLYDIRTISLTIREKGALFILDGTQFIGAYPYDHTEIEPDALIVAGYKWLLGPYAIGMAYYGAAFDQGLPLEETWLNRVKSDDFQYLTDYQSEYREGARRYEMGEAPDFIKIPMLQDALSQLIEWSPAEIQQYCRSLISPMLKALSNHGYQVPKEANMAAHLFGVGLPEGLEMDTVKREVARAKISVSYRGTSIRISPNVYNTQEELDKLTDVLTQLT